MIGSHFHRQVLATLIYILDTVALISAFVIVKLTPTLAGVSVAIIVAGFVFFGFLSYLGQRLMYSIVEDGEVEQSNTHRDSIDKTKGNENEAYVISDEKIGDRGATRSNGAAEKNSTNDTTMKPNNYTSTTYM